MEVRGGWLARGVSRYPASVGTKQSRELDPARILSQLIVYRSHLLLKGQRGYDVQLQAYDMIRSSCEIEIGCPVDDPKQHKNEHCKGAGSKGGPAKRACSYDRADAHNVAG